MDQTETELIAAVLRGDTASFEPLVAKYSPRVFATARRYGLDFEKLPVQKRLQYQAGLVHYTRLRQALLDEYGM